MLKTKYKNWQKDALRYTPLHPYELSEKGLSDIKRNVIKSILSLALVLALVILFYRMLIGDILPPNDENKVLRICLFFVFCGVISVTARISEKSSDHIMNTGLMMRIAVDDEFLDEWEVAQKHRSSAASYEWLANAIIGMFCLWLIVSFIAFMAVGHVLPLPPFDVNIAIGIVFIYIMSTLPLIHTAWTLEPMIDDEASAEGMRPPSAVEKALKAAKKEPKSWGKRILGFTPFIVGGFIGVWFVSRESGGIFYDAGYNLGQWFGQLIG